MSIYSGNRTGVASLADVRVNESYTDNDIGTILYESECNDMAFFEAILYSDLTEIRDLREGVITEADAEENNEEDKKSGGNKIIERLKKFWAKIKGFFKSIIDKIASYCDRDGVKLKYQIIAAKKENPNWRGKVEFDNYDPSYLSFTKYVNDIKGMMNNRINVTSEEETGRDAVNKILAKRIGDDDVTVSNFAKKCIEKSKHPDKIVNSNIDNYLDTISNGRDLITSIKRVQKDLEEEINSFLKTTKKDLKEHSDISKLNKQASTLETLVSVSAKGSIAVVKANIAAVRKALGKALSSIRNYKGEETEAEEAAAVAEVAIAFA